jgi:hypothetical protein
MAGLYHLTYSYPLPGKDRSMLRKKIWKGAWNSISMQPKSISLVRLPMMRVGVPW